MLLCGNIVYKEGGKTMKLLFLGKGKISEIIKQLQELQKREGK